MPKRSKKQNRPSKSKASARRIRKRKITRDPSRLEIIQVCAIIGEDYQATRTAMLKGAFGATKYDERSRKLTVARTAVSVSAWQAWKTAHAKPPKSVPQVDGNRSAASH